MTPPRNVESSDSRGTEKRFVTRKGDHIDVLLIHIDGDLSRRLGTSIAKEMPLSLQ